MTTMNEYSAVMIRYSQILTLLLFVSVLAASGCAFMFSASNTFPPSRAKESSEPSARYYYLTSKIHLAAEDFQAAEIYLKKAMAQDPDSSLLQRDMIRLHLIQNRKELARQDIQSLVREHPDNVENLLLFLQLNETNETQASEEQISILDKVLELDPQNKEAYLRLGKIYMEIPDYPRAETLFSRMTQAFPKDYVAWFYLGESCLKNQNVTRSRQAFARSIDLEPKLLEARFRLAELIRQDQGANLFRELTDIYQQILAIDPKNHQALMEMALLYVRQGQEEQADLIFDEIIPPMKKDPHLLMLAADYFISAKRSQDGTIIFSRLLTDQSENDFLNFFAGMVYESNQDMPAALACYRKISPGLPQYKKVVLNIAILYQNMGQPEKAISFLEERRRQHPGDTDIILYLLAFYDAHGHLKQALDLAEASVQQTPDSPSLLFKLGELYDKTNHRQKCIDTMKQVIVLDPKNANALNYLGYTYAEMGTDLDQALDLIKRALSIKPEDGYIIDSLGWVHFQQGNYEEAIIHLEKAAQMTEYEPIIADHLAQAYLKTSQPGMAISVYETSIRANKTKKQKDTTALQEKLQALQARTDTTSGQTK